MEPNVMTWRQLKDKIAELSDDKLDCQVLYEDDYDNLMPVNLYIQEHRALKNESWGTRVEVGMPKLGL